MSAFRFQNIQVLIVGSLSNDCRPISIPIPISFSLASQTPTHLVCRVCVALWSSLWYPVDDGASVDTRSRSVTTVERLQRPRPQRRRLVNSVGFDAGAFGCGHLLLLVLLLRRSGDVLSWAGYRGRGGAAARVAAIERGLILVGIHCGRLNGHSSSSVSVPPS